MTSAALLLAAPAQVYAAVDADGFHRLLEALDAHPGTASTDFDGLDEEDDRVRDDAGDPFDPPPSTPTGR